MVFSFLPNLLSKIRFFRNLYIGEEIWRVGNICVCVYIYVSVYIYTHTHIYIYIHTYIYIFVVVQLLNHVPLFVTPWTTACQASPSSTISWSLLRLVSLESVMLSNHLILCHSLFLLPWMFPSIRECGCIYIFIYWDLSGNNGVSWKSEALWCEI